MRLMTIALLMLLVGCSERKYSSQECPTLTSIHIIDREGLTEAISLKERVQNYEKVDFLKPQPYQKVLRVYSRDQAGNTRSYITTYHPNGAIKQYLEVLNNRAFGTYKEWHTNGALKINSVVVEGVADISLAAEKTWIFDGESTAYDQEGNRLATIVYCRGNLEGTSLYYHRNGSIWKEIPYSSNEISGEMKIYLDDGSLFQTQNFSAGKREGPSIRYWPSGQVAAQEYFKNGLLITGSYWDTSGESVAGIKEGEGIRALFGKGRIGELHQYRHGIQEGTVQIFDPTGTLLSVHSIKNGLKQGEEILYYPKRFNSNLKPKVSMSWYQGKIQGLVKTWYENGVQESQKEMSENKKNGVSSAWYNDGQLMLIEEYEKGKLKKGDYFRKGEKKPVSQINNSEGVATLFDAEGNYLRKVEYRHGKPET